MNKFKITDEPRDYSPLGLEENPFPYSPVPADEPEVYCGQDHVADAVSDTVSTVLSTGKSKHLVITGKYGNGKSHTLKYARSLVSDRNDVVVGYVAQPGEGFLDIYHEFIYDLGFDQIQEFAYEFLAQVARDTTDSNPIGAAAMRSLLDDGEVLLSELVPTAVQRLSDVTKFADFARAIVHMVYEDTNLYAWQWLTSEGIRYEQRKEMEIHSALDDDTMGVRAFTSLKNMLLGLGYKGIFMFVDEFESVARLSPKEEQATLNSIRHLMDQNSFGLSMMFGCAPEVWQDVMSEYHAFSERIGREVVLRPLTEENLENLIASYLKLATDRPVEVSDIFTEETLSLILQSSQGNIRQALSVCGYSLDEAINRDKNIVKKPIIEEVVN
ncbi:BREX system ATP-binding domain-containing protein [Natronorubrum sp. FCH18a]|uniref:BREX system ATP-binding domain-containing protein n=1 Tax=Natronorubrum sp. FCH18a TaxID=3447018 RepID=UPI003F51666A